MFLGKKILIITDIARECFEIDNADIINYDDDRYLYSLAEEITRAKVKVCGVPIKGYRLIILMLAKYLSVTECHTNRKTGVTTKPQHVFYDVKQAFTNLFDALKHKNPGCQFFVVAVPAFDEETVDEVKLFNGMVRTTTLNDPGLHYVGLVNKMGDGRLMSHQFEYKYTGCFNRQGWEHLVQLWGSKISILNINFK